MTTILRIAWIWSDVDFLPAGILAFCVLYTIVGSNDPNVIRTRTFNDSLAR